jgi:YVTN family beta-propeller protein
MAITEDRLYLSGFVLTVIDTSTNTVIETVPVGDGGDSAHSFGVAISDDGTKLYTTPTVFGDEDYTSSVVVYDINGDTLVPIADIPVDDASEVALSPDGSYAFVTNPNFENMSVIDTATNTLIATIPFEGRPENLAFSPDGKNLYVTVFVGGGEPDTVSVIHLG